MEPEVDSQFLIQVNFRIADHLAAVAAPATETVSRSSFMGEIDTAYAHGLMDSIGQWPPKRDRFFRTLAVQMQLTRRPAALITALGELPEV
jgi:hypothetical protein